MASSGTILAHVIVSPLCLAALLVIAASLRAAEAPPMQAAEIRLALEKLGVLGRAPYMAAHPDDENMALIAYWANGACFSARPLIPCKK